jgi:hypothetical protein
MAEDAGHGIGVAVSDGVGEDKGTSGVISVCGQFESMRSASCPGLIESGHSGSCAGRP